MVIDAGIADIACLRCAIIMGEKFARSAIHMVPVSRDSSL